MGAVPAAPLPTPFVARDSVGGAGGSELGAASPTEPPPETAIRASTVPTSTVSSTATRISATTPSTGAGTSVSILSVEMSQIAWSAPIRSPTSTRQPTTVPSATDTPIWGIVTSTRVVSVREEVTARLLYALDGRKDRLLQRRGERNRHVGRRDSDDRAVEILEALLGDQRRDLGARGAHLIGLVDDHHLRTATDRVKNRVGIQRNQRTQVKHLDRGSVQIVRGLQSGMHHRAIGDHDQVLTRARHAGLHRRLEHALRHLALDPAVQVLVLHETDGVRIADRRVQ